MRTDLPMAEALPPNSRCHAGQLSMATLGAPAFVSASVKVRPRAADTRSVGKKPSPTSAALTTRGVASPAYVTSMTPWKDVATCTNECWRSRTSTVTPALIDDRSIDPSSIRE